MTTTDEQDPELVVVFDLAGTVTEFHRSVAGIDGLEFLAELTEDEAEPDEQRPDAVGERSRGQPEQHLLHAAYARTELPRVDS